jgi:hypothetical protein
LINLTQKATGLFKSYEGLVFKHPAAVFLGSPLLAIAAVGILFAVSAPYSFIAIPLFIPESLLISWLFIRVIQSDTEYKEEKKRKQEQLAQDLILLDPAKTKPSEAIKIYIENEGYGAHCKVKKLLPNAIADISDDLLNLIAQIYIYGEDMKEQLLSQEIIQRLNIDTLEWCALVLKVECNFTNPIFFRPYAELFLRNYPVKDLHPDYLNIAKTHQGLVNKTIQKTLNDRAFERRRHAIAWRDQIDAENN